MGSADGASVTVRDSPDAVPAEGTPAIAFREVSQVFERPGSSSPLIAVQDIELEIRRGQFVAVVGPSGCGKSTLLGLVAGLLQPVAGRVEVEGKPVTGIRNDVGFVLQKDALLPWRTALENVALGLKYRGAGKRESREMARDWLVRVGLGGFASSYPHQLSGGMRKRVAIAATLAYEPKILLMDEPLSALDVQTRNLMENDILQLWQDAGQQTVLFVTHDLEEAIGLADRVVVMSASPGRIMGDYAVGLERPRNLLDVKFDPRFADLHEKIWQDLRGQVVQAYKTAQQPAAQD